jgi:hypothetical protein
VSVELIDHQRFIARVDLAFGDACWEWNGHRNDRGYGLIWHNGRHVRAHRVALILALGSIPDGLLVLHHCDNPSCVRPSHLFVGTQADNMRDMAHKGRGAFQLDPDKIPRGDAHRFRRDPELGRQSAAMMRERGDRARGERHGSAKLTAAEVQAIRLAYQSGDVKPTELGRRYGMSRNMIWRIVKGKSWRHINLNGEVML